MLEILRLLIWDKIMIIIQDFKRENKRNKKNKKIKREKTNINR